MKRIARVFMMLTAVICLCAGFTVTSSAKSSSSATGTYRYDYAFDELSYLNKTRTKAGKKKVKMDSYLTEKAMLRAAELSIKYSHTRPNGKAWYTIGSTNYMKAENIAYGYGSAKKVNKAWTDSKDHYKTRTTGSYTGVGIGCFQASDGTVYWIEEFGTYRSAAKKKSNSTTGSAKNVKVTLESADNASSGIKLTWKRAYGVSGYYVYRKTSGGSYKKIKTVSKASKTTYTDKTAKNGKKYTYKVVPYTKKDGKKGSGSTKSVTRIQSPSSLSVKNKGYGDVTVSWKKVSGVKGYRIEWSTSSSFKTCSATTVSGAGTTSKTLTGLTQGKTYYFRVKSYTKNGNSTVFSASCKKVSLKTDSKTVAVPKIVSVKSDASGKATVTWNKASGVSGYKVSYCTDKNFNGTSYTFTVNDASKTSYTISNLTSGKTYYFRVLAFLTDSGGTHESNNSDILSAKIQ